LSERSPRRKYLRAAISAAVLLQEVGNSTSSFTSETRRYDQFKSGKRLKNGLNDKDINPKMTPLRPYVINAMRN
jgi:hypothetical protein